MSRPAAMTVQFWGVRGSIPSPGVTTVRYGGNTACVSIAMGKKAMVVLDAGTGIRQLGKALEENTATVFVLLSHAHWDHIQGFPFFSPIYQPRRLIYLFPTLVGKSMRCAALEQMDTAHFPVTADHLPSRTYCLASEEMELSSEYGFHVSPIATNHPGGGTGYRLEHAGRSVVYLTDNELLPPVEPVTDFETFVEFCRHADLLIHDAQYLESDMPHKHGWGHSLVSQACTLAAAAQVKHLILFHHDPDRTDDELDALQGWARSWLRRQEHHVRCTAAYEGLVVEL